jgi:16S rRNA (cytosine967-C5)-methyltransferase
LKHLEPTYRILSRYYARPETNLKRLLSHHLERLKEREYANISRTVYGTVRNDQRLSHIIRHFSRIEYQKLHRDALILLKIGIYLLVFSEAFPDYAVVNEVVSLANNDVKGFINGMLRNIARNRQKVQKLIRSIQEPWIKYSISETLIRNLEDISVHPEIDLEYLNTEPVFHLRVNAGTATYEDLRRRLMEGGIEFRECPRFFSFEVKQAGTIIREIIRQGRGYFQNTAAQMISMIAGRFSQKSVFDCCAAPGTKAITLGQLRPNCRVFAADINLNRMLLMKTSLKPPHVANLHLLVTDIITPGLKTRFDLILVDAPCTSSGTLRKNPDLKLKIDEALIRKNAEKQQQILQSVIANFPGAYVLYSVCSFIKGETEDIMKSIAKNKKIDPIDILPVLEKYGFNCKRADFGVYLLPTPTLNNDIFYISLFKI